MPFPPQFSNRKPPLRSVLEESAAFENELEERTGQRELAFAGEDDLLFTAGGLAVLGVSFTPEVDDAPLAVGMTYSGPAANFQCAGANGALFDSGGFNLGTTTLVWVVVPPDEVSSIFFVALASEPLAEGTLTFSDRFDFSTTPPTPTRILGTVPITFTAP